MSGLVKEILEKWHNSGGFTESDLSECFGDVYKLAYAYADEHPADDDEPMTCQWLVDAGFAERSHRCFDLGDITLSQNIRNGIPVEWVLYLRGFEARMSKCPRTRGDVRRLCAALGLPVKGVIQ